MASRSASDVAALKLLKKLAGTSRTVLAETTVDNGAVVCSVRGMLSSTSEGLLIEGEGRLIVDLNSVEISSCKFDEALSGPPSMADAELDVSIGVPFASFHLMNGTRIALYRVTALPKV
jgi:hypothetical protein